MTKGMDFFAYEVWMMRETAGRLARGEADTVIRNALLESFLIHARALVGFFDRRVKDDDIIARDYVPTWAETIPQSLRDECDRINKQVAHLTTTRHTAAVPEKQHDVAAILQQLEDLIGRFLPLVDSAHLGDRFTNLQVTTSFVVTNCTTSMDLP